MHAQNPIESYFDFTHGSATMSLHVSVIYKRRTLTQLIVGAAIPIRDLKRHIAKVTGIPTNIQTLTFQGYLLEDSYFLADYRPPPVTKLCLDLPLKYTGKFKVFVTTPFQGRPLKLRVRMESTLEELKQTLSRYENIPINQQIIVHNSCVLDGGANALTLAALGIKPNAEIELMLKQSEFGAIYHARKTKIQPETTVTPPPSDNEMSYDDEDKEVVVGRYRVK